MVDFQRPFSCSKNRCSNTPKSSKKTKSCIAESERAAANEKQLALFLLLSGLIKVRELRFFGGCYWLVWVCLVIEFERVIGGREVLLRLFFDFPVSFDPIKKLGAVTFVFGLSRLTNFKSVVMLLFLFLSGLSVVAGQILATGESSGVQHSPANHDRDARHCIRCKIYF